MTRIHVHELTGLKPDALATYLSALGVFRLLAEQRDPEVRAFWRDEHFVLVTTLEWAEIEKFFADDYAPTPIVAPWNMESGFFSLKPSSEHSSDTSEIGGAPDPDNVADTDLEGETPTSEAEEGDDEEDETEQAVADPLLDRFGATTASRFSTMRDAIKIARAAIPDELRQAEKNVRRAHEEVRSRSDNERKAFEEACGELEDARRAVAEAKVLVEQKRVAARGASPGAPERDEFQAAQQRLKEAREREKCARQEKKTREKELKKAERLAANDQTLRDRIAEVKKRFKEVQSGTKMRLIADLRARWRADGQQWVDAAVALDERSKKGFEFTSLFGSGGNDGRMEFTKNFRHHLECLFDVASGYARDDAAARLRGALFGGPNSLLTSKAVGQFFPGRAGGPNMGAGFFGGAAVNSWEFVLMLEGAVALVAGMSRRGEVGRARVSSPFWVEAAAAGFGSASEREGSPRGEQWLPLWSQPARYSELVELIRESRAQVGRQQATQGGTLVRATARLGLARGIDALQRFAYLERNGQSNLAVFAGRFHVRSRAHQELLDDIAPWVERLVRHAKPTKENNVPASLGAAARQTEEALFSVCRRNATPREWRDLLIALGEAERALLRSGKNPRRRPLPPLRTGWIDAVDDGTPEGRCALRLALAFASQHRPVEDEKGQLLRFHDSIRQHFVPLVDDRRFDVDERGRPKLGPEQVCAGRDLVADAIALMERRSVWARSSKKERGRAPRLPLQAMPGCEARLEEVGAWIRGEVADREVLGLARALLALDWAAFASGASGSPLAEPMLGDVPEPLHLVFRLAHLPFDVPVLDSEGKAEVAVTVRLDPEPLRRLARGDLDGALRVAIRRLEASGLRPMVRRAVATPSLARRLAASLAFPVSRAEAARAARLICKPYALKGIEEAPAIRA